MEYAEYCRELEAYLCRKNGGHLVRIVGPAFDRVCGWAAQGVPLKVACGGIDRFCERQQVKAGRRRPIRIEFCEADILELFDDWRRAVGVVQGSSQEQQSAPRKPSLTAHIERVVSRLVARRTQGSAEFDAHVQGVLADLDALMAGSKQSRGEARAAIIDRLATIEDALVSAAAAQLDASTAASIRREADEELAPFKARMSAEAREQALQAAFHRLVRESLALPAIRYE